MSVINDMLAQLDKRRAKPVAVGETLVAALAAPAARGGRWKLLALVGVGTVVLSATALGNWPDLMRPSAGHLPRPVAMGVDVPAVAASAVAVVAAPASAAASELIAMVAPAIAQAPQQDAIGPSLSKPHASLSTARPTVIPSPSNDTPRANVDSPAAEPVAPASTESSIDKKMATLSPSQRAESHYRQATELAASGHSTQAIDRALEALKADVDHLAARQLAVVLMVEKSRFDEAAGLLHDGLERTPQQPQLSYLLARIKVETGDRSGALTLLQDTEALSAEGFALRAGLLSQQGQYAGALPSYEAALRKNPDVATTWLGLAVALDAQGQTDSARKAFLRAKAVGAARGELSAELQTYIEQKLAATR